MSPLLQLPSSGPKGQLSVSGHEHPQLMESCRWTLNSSPYFVTILVFLLLGLQKERGRDDRKDEKGGVPSQ